MQSWMPVQAAPDQTVLDKMKQMEQQIADLTMANASRTRESSSSTTLQAGKRPRNLMESFTAAAQGGKGHKLHPTSTSSSLPVQDANEDANEEGEELQASPLAQMERGDLPRVLQKSFPAGFKALDVTNWIKKLSLTFSKLTSLKNLTDKMYNHYTALPTIQQGGLGNIAVDWGLQCKAAGKMSDDILLRVLAVAICLTN